MSEIKTIGIIGGGLSGLAIEMFPPIDQAWLIDRWTEEAKEAVAELAIMALSKIHKMDIAVKRVQSPKDYRERMHLFCGALYGLSPAADPRVQFPHKTSIEGLFQAGQTTYPGYGIGTAAMSGVFAAEALMKTVQPTLTVRPPEDRKVKKFAPRDAHYGRDCYASLPDLSCGRR